MKSLSLAFAFSWLLISPATTAVASSSYPSLPRDIVYGTPPAKNVKNWVRLNVLGERNAPWPIIWLSPQRFSRSFPETVITLSRREYRALEVFALANGCPVVESSYPSWGTLQVTDYSSGREHTLCIMPREKACGYLSNLVANTRIGLVGEKLEPVRELSRGLSCSSD
jgi:hypothetical protein